MWIEWLPLILCNFLNCSNSFDVDLSDLIEIPIVMNQKKDLYGDNNDGFAMAVLFGHFEMDKTVQNLS